MFEQFIAAHVLQTGFGAGSAVGSAVLLVNRIFLGLFFSIGGFHKLFNRRRHAELVSTLRSARIPLVGLNQWWVPGIEFLGGLGLLAGVLAPLAALALAFELLIAVWTDGPRRIQSYGPIDRADWLDDLLYLPEMVGIVTLLVVVALGPGPFTLPALLS
jgi:uncharacterized membrane protein YphA (DoxX/SURF4 family)